MALLVILLVALADFFLGSVIGPRNDTIKSKGFVGYSGKLYLLTCSQRYNFVTIKRCHSANDITGASECSQIFVLNMSM